MPKRKPKPQVRGLAAGLRAKRKETMLSSVEVAERLGWSQSTISRIETGRRNVSPDEVSAILTVYGVDGLERDSLVEMARDVDRSNWLETRYADVPPQAKTLAQYEAEAVRLVNFALILIPGLLQTASYTRTLMNSAGVPASDIGARVNLRLERQQVLDKPNAPHLVAFLDEAALHRTFGGRRVMAEQLRHLLAMAERPGIDLRVIPFDHGGHPGVDGAYALLEFEQARPVVHLEHRCAGLFLDEPADVDPFVEVTASLAAVALDATHSAELVREILARYQRE
jgi:transcriptional regulator with XRE-family HTH domain